MPVAFQSFFDAHAGVVLGFLVSLVGPQEAEDCFQETFLAALRAYPDVDRDTNLRAWVLTIARHKAIDAFRARGRRPDPVADTEDGPWAPRASAPMPSPSTADPDLWRAIRALPDKQRGAIFLRYVADLPHREIGEALDCSEAAARRNAHEGLKKLKETWS